MRTRLDSTKWLRRKTAVFEEKSYPYLFAALLHIYFGSLTLKEIAEQSGLTLHACKKLRQNPRFMRFTDTFKKDISCEIREDLISHSYEIEDYDSLASDFSLFDEIVQIQIRVPLFSMLKDVSDSIENKHTNGLKLDEYELSLFRKLFSFFILAEKYTPTLASRSLKDIRQVAERIVWPALNLDEKGIEQFLGRPCPDREERIRKLRNALNVL